MVTEKIKLIVVGTILYVTPTLSIKAAEKWFANDPSLESYRTFSRKLFRRFWIYFIISSVLFFGFACFLTRDYVLPPKLLVRLLSVVLLVTSSLSGPKRSEYSWVGNNIHERIAYGMQKLATFAGILLLIYVLTSCYWIGLGVNIISCTKQYIHFA